MPPLPGDVASRLAEVEVRARLLRAFEGFHAEWLDRGGHRFYGYPSKDDPATFIGRWIWSEHDCTYRFAEFLEREFPRRWIHFEQMVVPATFPVKKGGQAIDLVVSDLDRFVEGEVDGLRARERMRTHRHLAFVETKWFRKPRWPLDVNKLLESVVSDADIVSRRSALRPSHRGVRSRHSSSSTTPASSVAIDPALSPTLRCSRSCSLSVVPWGSSELRSRPPATDLSFGGDRCVAQRPPVLSWGR